MTWTLALNSGDADLYVWHPRLNQGPDDISVNKTPSQVVGVFAPEETGEYIIEVHAVTPTTYRLIPSGDVELSGSATLLVAAAARTERQTAQATAESLIPMHTLTRGSPILDVPALPAAHYRIFVPMVESGSGG
jgi:hypothetical protein